MKGCEIWFPSVMEQQRKEVFVSRALRKIFGKYPGKNYTTKNFKILLFGKILL
jgi:hypothetical protein